MHSSNIEKALGSIFLFFSWPKEGLQIKNLVDNQLVQDVIHDLASLLQNHFDSKVKIFASIHVIKFLKISGNNDQLVRDVLKALISLFTDQDLKIADSASDLIPEVMTIGPNDPQLIKDTINDLLSYLQEIYQDKKTLLLQNYRQNSINSLATTLRRVIKISGDQRTQLIRDILNFFTLESSDPSFRKLASETIIRLIEIGGSDQTQLAKEAVNNLIPLFESSLEKERGLILENTRELRNPDEKPDIMLFRDVLLTLNGLLKCCDNGLKKFVSDKIIASIKRTLLRDTNVLKDRLEIWIQLFQNFSKEGIELIWIEHNQIVKDIQYDFSQMLQNGDSRVRYENSIAIIRFMKIKGSIPIELAWSVFQTLAPFLEDHKFKNTTFDHIIQLMEISDHKDVQLTENAIETLTPLLENSDWSSREAAAKFIPILMKIRESHDTQFVRDAIDVLIPLLEVSDNYLRKVAYDLISHSILKPEKSETEIRNDIWNRLTPNLQDPDWKVKTAVSTTLIEFIRKIVNDAAQRAREISGILTSIFIETESKERYSLLDHIAELTKMSDFNENPFFLDALKVLAPYLEYLPWEFSNDIMALKDQRGKSDAQLASDTIKQLIPLLKENDENLVRSASRAIIKLTEKYGEIEAEIAKELSDTLSPLLKDLFWVERKFASGSIIEFMKLSVDRDPQFVQSMINKLIENLHSQQNAAQTLLQQVFLEISLRNSAELKKNFNNPSKAFRALLMSTLQNCLEKYVENFERLNQLFQHPKSSLTLMNIEKLFIEDQRQTFKQIKNDFRLFLGKLQTENLSNDDYSQILFELKSFLVSKLDRIGDIEGPQIIKLALVIINNEKISEDGLDNENLIKIARKILDRQLENLNDEGLKWINDNYEDLISLPSETKSFFQGVCHKILKDQEITPLKEELMIKFIHQGLTYSLTRNGKIVFEGRHYHLRGDDLERTFEKLTKTILGQQQDILALQYKEHVPIFVKSYKGGMKEAAVDQKEVKSIVDSRHTLSNDFWLLTRLRSLKFKSEIIILEKRTIFGDHFIYHLTGQREFRFYPNELPVLTEIFGSYIYGEVYQGELKELTDEVGQKLFESKSKKQIHKIPGEIKENQIYFQQELLRQGNEERNKTIEQELARKLNNNRTVLESNLKPLNLPIEKKISIDDYYDGFVLTISSMFTSSQAIVSGQVSIEDGEDFLSFVNIFIKLVSYAPFDSAKKLSGNLEAVRAYLKSNEIKQKAKIFNQIAVDAVELSDLVGNIMREIISKPVNQQRIFEAKEEDETPTNNTVNKIKNFVLEKIEKAKELTKKYQRLKYLFLEEIKTNPAFKLGADDANKIIKGWIELRESKPNLRLNPTQKHKMFVQMLSRSLQQPLQQPNLPKQKKGDRCEIF